MKEAFRKAGKSIGKEVFSPCYDSIPCPVTENNLMEDPEFEKRAACAEVFSGHFTTKLIPTLGKIAHNKETKSLCKRREWSFTAENVPTSPVFDCLIAMREPISRFVSHYYHFVEKEKAEFKGKKLASFSLDELTQLVHSVANNTMVEYLSKHLPDMNPSREAKSFTMDEKIDEAENVLNKCTIVMMEDWTTSITLAETVNPWLTGHLLATKAKNVAPNRISHESIEDFSPEQASALNDMLRGDIALYKKAIPIYQAQLDNFGVKASETDNDGRKNVKEGQKQNGDRNASLPLALSIRRQFPAMVKSVTYFGRGNPLNFWDQRFESFIDMDFKKIRADGFNTITLLLPWSSFQTTMVPPTYKSFFLDRVEFVLKKAVEHGLYTIFRVSYPHSFDPAVIPKPNERCELIMAADTSNGVKEGWLSFLSVMNSIFTKPEYKNTYLYSYFSWEDFFCLLSFGQSAPDDQRVRLSKQIGFAKFLTDQYAPSELKDMYPDSLSGEYPIPRWDINDAAFAPYIKFIDSKWWDLVERGRAVLPNLSMEVRVGIEGGKVPYDMHLDDNTEGNPMQGYWAGYMGAPSDGQWVSAEQGVKSLEKVLAHSSGNGQSPIILGQFNLQDNTPHMMSVMKGIDLIECNKFIEMSAAVLKKYTKGYGLWAHRSYRQSEVYNGSFLLGLEGWSSQKGNKGSIVIHNNYLLLSGLDHKSFAKVEQGVRQLPRSNCDDGNSNMEVCFKYRMNNETNSASRFHVVWDGKKEHAIAYSAIWTEKCVRVPSLDENTFYNIGFLVEGIASVNIDNVEMSCHTHKMYMHDVDYKPISTCGDGLPVLNKLLG